MCGEHLGGAAQSAGTTGSSPHVRGTHVIRGVDLVAAGIIPACAGNTGHRGGGTLPAWDHPRMCGEHSGVDLATYGPQGSSPHVRGTPRRLRTAGRMGGIIPACAGNTGCSIGALIGRWDHPRMCGEHRVPVDDETVGEGSSPHVRGNTSSAFLSSAVFWDHPRMCGEHFEGGADCRTMQGSSPHVRGTLATA